jgi:hypothetical protein
MSEPSHSEPAPPGSTAADAEPIARSPHRSHWRRFSPSMGWRAFSSEILIVVLGVAIALAASEAVEDWNWRKQVRDGEARVRSDVQNVFVWSAEHYAAHPCVDAQLDQLAQRVLESGATLMPAPLHRNTTAPVPLRFVLRMPNRSWRFSTWDALVADGTANRFSPQWQNTYNMIRDYAARIQVHRYEANRLTGTLVALSYPIELDPAARQGFLVDIETLRLQNTAIAIQSGQLLAGMTQGGIAATPQAVESHLASSGTVKSCQEQGLPLADWRDGLDDAGGYGSPQAPAVPR